MFASIDWTAIGTCVLAGGMVLGLIGAWVQHDRAETRRNNKLDELLTEVKPNGGKSLSLGDTAKRTEDTTKRTADQLAQLESNIKDGHEELRKEISDGHAALQTDIKRAFHVIENLTVRVAQNETSIAAQAKVHEALMIALKALSYPRRVRTPKVP